MFYKETDYAQYERERESAAKTYISISKYVICTGKVLYSQKVGFSLNFPPVEQNFPAFPFPLRPTDLYKRLLLGEIVEVTIGKDSD